MEASPEVQEMADESERFAKRFYRRELVGRHLIVCGKFGTGKTHCAEHLFRWSKRIAIEAYLAGHWPNPPRIEMFEWAKIVNLETAEFRNWLADRSETHLIFLEDMGAEVDRFKTGEPMERLREILNDFKNRFLFATTNIMPCHWQKVWDARIEDRLLRDSIVIELKATESFTAQ